MGIRGARWYPDEILVGRSVPTRYGQLQELHRYRAYGATGQGRQLRGKSVWIVRHGWRRRSVGRGLLAPKLPGCSDGWLGMDGEPVQLPRHPLGILEE